MPLSSLIPAAFRRHAEISEAAPATPIPGAGALPERTGYIAGIPQGGINENNASVGASTGTDRKSLLQELFDSYLACPWAWVCVNAISRTITAGGLVTDWDADDGEGDQEEPDKPAEVVALERFYAFCNPTQDIVQLLRNAIADLLVFGDALLEIVWSGTTPVALYNLDVPTTSPCADEHGTITHYVQVTDFGQRAEFDVKDVIHISLDSARPGVFGVSPTQAMLGPITGWLFAAATEKEMFRKGLPANIHVDMPAGKSDTELTKWRNQYVAQNIGPRNIGNPVVTRDHATVAELQAGKITDVLAAKADYRDEIVAGYGTPPAEAGIIESGNLGGGTADGQHRMFMLNTCMPIAAVVLEKLNFHVATEGFGVQGWHSKFGEVDYRDSAVVETIRNNRVTTGLYTLNKGRREIGEPEVDGGNDAMYASQRYMILYKDLPAFSAATVAGAGGSALTPPAPPPDPDAPPPGQQDGQDDDSDDDGKGSGKPGQKPPPGKPPTGEALRLDYQAAYRDRLREAMQAFKGAA